MLTKKFKKALTAASQELETLRIDREGTRRQLARCLEELYVVRSMLIEKGIATESQLTDVRTRLIERPRKEAKARKEVIEELDIEDNSLLIEPRSSQLH